MARLSREETERLHAAITTADHLQRVLDEIERQQRLVFHSMAELHWDRVRASAEQILIAEIVVRHNGDPEGAFLALRALEDGGRTWDEAVRDLAAQVHSYFTTPLGIVLRRDLFGRKAAFIAPDAVRWLEHR